MEDFLYICIMNYVRNCPCCNTIITYKTRGGFYLGNKNNSVCNHCKVVLNNPNVIEHLTKDNCKEYTAGQIIRYIYTFPYKEWENKFTEVLNYFNPDIEYQIIGRVTAREKSIQYKCKIHPTEWNKTDFRHIVDRHSGCRMCKGQHFQNYWTEEQLISSMSDLVFKLFKETGCTFTVSSLKEWDSKLFNAWFKNINNPSEVYYQLLSDLKLPNPSKGVYVKDNHIFRGFYEFVGYCLITHWKIPFEYSPKVFDKYYSDGYFTEINTHWEHWGELNRNNKTKVKLYLESNFGLFQTLDKICGNKGITYLYNEIRNFLISNNYNIPEMSHSELLGIIKGNISTFETSIKHIIKIINQQGWNKKITEQEMRKSYEGNVILSYINKFFEGSILKLKEYLNNQYQFNYTVTAFRRSYKDQDYFISKIKDIIDEYGYIPTQKYFSEVKRNDIPVMASRMFGGLNNLKRNEIEEGSYFYLVKDLYPNNSAPNDRDLVWCGNENYDNTVKKIIKYYKELGYEFPNIMNTLRNDKKFSRFGPILHSAISRNNEWETFVSTYKSLW